ncbi:uncharacterized protein LOC108000528 [Apis cerana]|uniref:uncharacterized protein LOC108000528 n=1 Tax=Apis cerana TaxID=7461 RepID=UPI002B232E84|nr:uncharacterized protein LOC108000528 [Apis cerana]XP_061935647.1 uncharacterized protein LOC108000528 [Apis cerana]
MRMKLLKIVVVLLVLGSSDARPQRTESSIQAHASKANLEEWKTSGVREDSSIRPNDTQRRIKDLQHIDQSLRTVATQLLNVTNGEQQPAKILDNAIKKGMEKSATNDEAGNDRHPIGVGFGRPINSKFSYFETSHPGQAMAITEEELEKEMASTRLITAYKNHATTTGGISTWILLNPPSTTVKTLLEERKKTRQPIPETEEARITPSAVDTAEERTATTEKAVTLVPAEEESVTRKSFVLPTTTSKIESKLEKVEQGTEKVSEVIQSTTVSKIAQVPTDNSEFTYVNATRKNQTASRTTPKPKIAITKTTVLASKPSVSKTPNRPNLQNRPKHPSRNRTTVKPDVGKNESVSVGKIEKVTFRPVQMIAVPKSTEKPMFVTKIKASILMDNQKATTPQTSTSGSAVASTTSKPTSTDDHPSLPPAEAPVSKLKPVGTKVNNVLKVQLRKPVDETRIEIEPIKVNAPVLKIEKVEKGEGLAHDAKIDLMKFDFNPELTKINVDQSSSSSTSSSTTTPSTTSPSSPTSSSSSSSSSSSTTTKRPKRKKNKNRRRKPIASTTTSTTTVVPSSPMPGLTEEAELGTEIPEEGAENGIAQESKIAPETKVGHKTKKKPAPASGISSQIYNFLSREVMPSFGVMSLVGLGLGLASYFLYPFGGTATRRNYVEVEPKYKYNFEEYGGNYGQSEEEVLSKVLQGMTTDETKGHQGSKVFEDNYYAYQRYDQPFDHRQPQSTNRNGEQQRYSSPTLSSPVYHPPENTAPSHKYTDYRYYSDPSSTPPNPYHDHGIVRHREYVVGSGAPGSANRQFVVGSVPNAYPTSYEEKILSSSVGKLGNGYGGEGIATESSGQTRTGYDATSQNFNNMGTVQNYGQIKTARPAVDEGYEEVEITPTAVAVEHGPRSLRIKRSAPGSSARDRRDSSSVIQIIPSKRELEEERREEELSNEILDIIDSALPAEGDYEEDGTGRRKKKKEGVEAEDELENEKRDSSTVVSSTRTIESSSSTSSSSSSSLENSDSEGEAKGTSTVESVTIDPKKPAEQNGFNLFNFVKKIAEIKFRLGLTLLKHASEGFARYLGHVQKRINGEE